MRYTVNKNVGFLFSEMERDPESQWLNTFYAIGLELLPFHYILELKICW